MKDILDDIVARVRPLAADGRVADALFHEAVIRSHARLSYEEAAEILGISRRTAVRMWQTARAWLYGQLSVAPGA